MTGTGSAVGNVTRHPMAGYFEAVAAASMWGSSGIFSVYLFRMGVSPESVALLRPVLGLLFLLVFVALFRRDAIRESWTGIAVMLLAGAATVGVFQVAYQRSMDAVGVPTTVALLYLAPAIVAAAAGPMLGEWPSRSRVALALLAVTGVWLMVSGAERVTGLFGASGYTWGVYAGLSYAGYTLFGRWSTPRYGSLATVVYTTLGGCIVLAVVLPFSGAGVALPTRIAPWGVLVAFGLLTIAVAQLLFFDALGRAEASRVSVASTAEPVVASVLAAALLSQYLSPRGWLGLFLVVTGVAGVGALRGGVGRNAGATGAGRHQPGRA